MTSVNQRIGWRRTAAGMPALAAVVALLATTGLQSAAAQNAPSSAAAADQSPSDLVQATAQGILKDLDANREAYRKDPNKLGQLVDKWLLPHFDTEYAARLVLGRYWRDATPDQRQ